MSEDEKHQFEYDANGNMLRKTVKASGATWRYSYTVWDELASASRHASADAASPITEKVSYTFDALGRRVSERRYDGGGALTGGTNFHYDGEEVAHEVAVDAVGAVIAGSAKWTTHSDGVDDLLSVTPQAGTGPVSPTATTSGAAMPSANGYYYHTDHQGSVRAIIDQSGTITNAYAYDSYGTAEESVESLAQRFRYTGREFDALTGLYHYRARAYDPETAKFLQEDPLWFDALDLNVYRYVSSNPVNWIDPSGMFQAGERKGTYAVALGAANGLTIQTVRVSPLVWRWNGTRMVLTRIVKQLVLEAPRGLGCFIGASLASIGASMFGATDIAFTPDGCSVTWDYQPHHFSPPQPAPAPEPALGPKKPNPKPLPPTVPSPQPRPKPQPGPGPKPNPKGTGPDDKDCAVPTHRGRIQIQGQTRPSDFVNISWAWDRCSAPTKSEALGELDKLYNSLTEAQKAQRDQALVKANRFINSGPIYVTFPSKSFQNSEYLASGSPRIDMSIFAGVAFVD